MDTQTILTLASLKSFDFKTLSSSPNLPFDVLPKLEYGSWDWDILSKREDLTINIVSNLRTLPWNWAILSKKFPLSDILEHPDLPWDFDIISKRDSFTNSTLIIKTGKRYIEVSHEFMAKLYTYEDDEESSS